MFGNRALLAAEERFADRNQYYLLEKAGVPYPVQFSSPNDIDRLVIVKVPEKQGSSSEAFSLSNHLKITLRKQKMLIDREMISAESLQNAVIEEFVVGPVINLNFFYSPLTESLELLGTDMRRQANIDGIIRLPAWQQLELADTLQPKFEEAGHVACTI